HMRRQQQFRIADPAAQTEHPRPLVRARHRQDALCHVGAQRAHRRPREMALRETGVQLLVVFQFALPRAAHAGFRRLRNAIAARNSETASIDPSRTSVFQEINSLGPKQPQLISLPPANARTIRLKNTSSSRDVLTVEMRNQRPAINKTPANTSNQGSVCARNLAAHMGTTS